MAELTHLQKRLIRVKAEIEAARQTLTEREWTSYLDIVRRQVEHELGEDE